MTAKEKQLTLMKAFLKPMFKQHGFKNRSRTWWKDKDEFLIIVDLQNLSWNSKDDVTFCFNTGIALKATLTDFKKPSYHNRIINIRESFYLSPDRKEHRYRNKTGYKLVDNTDLESFIKELKRDFESQIMPQLEHLQSLNDCLDLYGNVPFWGELLYNTIANVKDS